MVARINHPNIIKVYDFEARQGQYISSDDEDSPIWEPPVLYTAMEYISRSLRDRMGREITISAGESIRITIEVCKGLEYLHSNGLIHGDIRPAHILIGDNSEVKISNFLSVKRWDRSLNPLYVGAPGSPSPFLDLTDLQVKDAVDYEVSGTPEYMPPELWRNGRLDGRSDIYSLGITLYEMLTGELPFSGQQMELFMKHQNEPLPDFPSGLNVYIGLRSVIERATAKDMEARFSSAAEFRSALETANSYRMS